MNSCFLVSEAEKSEAMATKMKILDSSVTQVQVPPVKTDVQEANTFMNNQTKFPGGAATIPPSQLKCNILKAKMEAEMKKGISANVYCMYSSVYILFERATENIDISEIFECELQTSLLGFSSSDVTCFIPNKCSIVLLKIINLLEEKKSTWLLLLYK